MQHQGPGWGPGYRGRPIRHLRVSPSILGMWARGARAPSHHRTANTLTGVSRITESVAVFQVQTQVQEPRRPALVSTLLLTRVCAPPSPTPSLSRLFLFLYPPSACCRSCLLLASQDRGRPKPPHAHPEGGTQGRRKARPAPGSPGHLPDRLRGPCSLRGSPR